MSSTNRPRPDFSYPLPRHERAAILTDASYIRHFEGEDALRAYLNARELVLISSTDHSIFMSTLRGELLHAYRGADFAKERHNITRVLRGELPDYFESELALFKENTLRYGQPTGVYGYSLSGDGMIHEFARRGLLNDAREVVSLNPLIGPRGVRYGIGSNTQVARTVEDYASGPGLSLGLRNKTISRSQISTIRGVAGLEDHNLGHFLGDETHEVRGPTPLQTAYENKRFYTKSLNDSVFAKHLEITHAVVNGLSLIATDILVESIAPNQNVYLKDIEKGVGAGVVQTLAKRALLGGSLTSAGFMGEIAPVVVGVEAYDGISRTLEAVIPRSNERNSITNIPRETFIGAASGGGATAVGVLTQATAGAAATAARGLVTGEAASLVGAGAFESAAAATGVGALLAADVAATAATIQYGHGLWMDDFWQRTRAP